jgi:hypothetical protein
MGVLLKYTLESIVIAGATAVLTSGKLSQRNILLLAALSFFIFIILDLVAPINSAHLQLGGAEDDDMYGGAEDDDMYGGAEDDDMNGGGLVQALQEVPVLTGGNIEAVNDQPFKFQNHPYKLHGGVLSAGYNEDVYGFSL